MKINEVEIQNITSNSFLNHLEEKNYTSIDSYTIDQSNNSISGLIVLNRELNIPTNEDVIQYFSINSNKKHLIDRLSLAYTLKIPLYLISIDDNFQNCQILEFNLSKNNVNNKIDVVFSCVNNRLLNLFELHDFLQSLRNEKRSKLKPLTHIPGSDLISKLNQIGISLGGNLDGFYLDKENKSFKLIEFTKIGAKKPDNDGYFTANYNFNKYIDEDFGRWHALETLRLSIEKKYPTSLDIIVWSYSTPFLKIIKDVKFTGDRNKFLVGTFKEEVLFENRKANNNKP